MATNGFAASVIANNFSSGSAGANSIFLTQVAVIRQATIVAVLQNVNTAASGVQFKAVIYDTAHSALLGSGSLLSSIAAGYNRYPLTSSVVLAAGTYYVGYACNTAVSVSILAGGSNSWFVSGGQSASSPANPLVGGASNASNLGIALEFDGSTAGPYGYAPDYTSGVTLSGIGNITAAMPNSSSGARSVVTQSTVGGGKYYAEVAIAGTIINLGAIGVTAACSSLATLNAAGPFNAWMGSSGTVTLTGGTTNTSGIGFASGDVVGVAYDAGAGLLWFNRNNGSWGGNGAGNPVTGTGGVSVAPGGWPMMLFTGQTGAGAGAPTYTLRDYAAAQQYAAPSGFTAWSSYSSVAPPTQAYAVVMA